MNEVSRTISRGVVNELPIRRMRARFASSRRPQDLERAMADILQESVVGPRYRDGPAFRTRGEPPALPDASRHRTLRVPVSAAAHRFASRELAELLGPTRSSSRPVVSLAHDLRQLKLVFPFEQAAVVDLGDVARHGRRRPERRGNPAANFLGFRIPKGNRTPIGPRGACRPSQNHLRRDRRLACRSSTCAFTGSCDCFDLPPDKGGAAAGERGFGFTSKATQVALERLG